MQADMKHTILKIGSCLGILLGASHALADEVKSVTAPGAVGVTLYSMPNHSGRNLRITRDTPKLKKLGFANMAMSIRIGHGQWEVCDDNQYKGNCEVFGPGDYRFSGFGWAKKIKSVRHIKPGTPLITLYSGENMKGKSHTYANNMPHIKDFATNDFAHSLKVTRGAWVLCEDSKGKGKCETVRRNIPNLAKIGLAGAISSVYRAQDWHNDDPYIVDGVDDRDGRYNNGYDNRRRRAQIVLFDGLNYSGARITIDTMEADLRNSGFSNRALSVHVLGGVWELCDGANYTKTCKIIDRDEPDLGNIYLSYQVTSLRPVSNGAGQAGRPGGYGDRGGRKDTHGIEGIRTIFFPEPSYRGENVANCLYTNSRCGTEAADAFCHEKGLARSVYFDVANSYRPPFLLGEKRRARQSNQQKLIDVVCRR